MQDPMTFHWLSKNLAQVFPWPKKNAASSVLFVYVVVAEKRRRVINRFIFYYSWGRCREKDLRRHLMRETGSWYILWNDSFLFISRHVRCYYCVITGFDLVIPSIRRRFMINLWSCFYLVAFVLARITNNFTKLSVLFSFFSYCIYHILTKLDKKNPFQWWHLGQKPAFFVLCAPASECSHHSALMCLGAQCTT